MDFKGPCWDFDTSDSIDIISIAYLVADGVLDG